jgi:hypothetical protein
LDGDSSPEEGSAVGSSGSEVESGSSRRRRGGDGRERTRERGRWKRKDEEKDGRSEAKRLGEKEKVLKAKRYR